MHPCNTNKYCFGHLPPPCTASPTPQLRAHLRLLVVMIFAKGERNCTGRTVSEHLANRKAGKAHNKHAQMLTFSVARSPLVAIPRQDPKHQLPHFGARFCSGCTTHARRLFELLHRCCFATSLGWLFAVKRIVTALDTGIENVPFFVGATSKIALKHLIR